MSKNKRDNTKYHSIYLRIFVYAALIMCATALFTGCTKRADLITPQERDASGESMIGASLAGGDTFPGGAGQGASNRVLATDADQSAEDTSPTANTDSDKIYVHVCGAVVAEGLYELNSAARVNDALDAAGGFLPEADRTYLNLAAELTDGMQIAVPFLPETGEQAAGDNADIKPGQGRPAVSAGMSTAVIPSRGDSAGTPGQSGGDSAGTLGQSSGLININTATLEELCSLTGIGTAKATDIIAYRDSNGRFLTTEDLMKVSGIGEKMYAKVKDKITVQ